MVIVQIVKVGSEVRAYDISENPTLENALEKAGEVFVENTITINSANNIEPNTRLVDGDRVFIGSLVKGNTPFVVEFIRLGQGEVIRVSVESPVTIRQCVDMMSSSNRARFVDAEGGDVFQYQISGIVKESDSIVADPSVAGGTIRVICGVRVKGN